MNHTSKIGWFSASKEALPGILVGMERLPQDYHPNPESALGEKSDFAVAIDLDAEEELRLPKFVVMRDENVDKLLGWLHTYSTETFPVSQYCRTTSLQEWNLLDSHLNLQAIPRYSNRWSGVICGEILGQAEPGTLIKTLPLGWAHGCLSYAMARAWAIYGEAPSEMYSITGSRLLDTEDDIRLQRKKFSATSLVDVWSCASSLDKSSKEVAVNILGIVANFDPEMSNIMRSNPGITSSSAERRIAGFDDVVDRALQSKKSGSNSNHSFALVLAASAFLAGRGTSHIALIEPYAKDYPEAYVWFGLMAGIAGPTYWDRDWLRFSKGVERVLNSNYSIFDAPQADISWIEYQWLSRNSKSDDIYSSVVKHNPRSLILELNPGVICQFRVKITKNILMEQPESVDALSSNADQIHDINNQSKVIDEARDLIKKLQLVLSPENLSGKKQASLFNEAVTSDSVTNRAPRKSKKTPKN